MDVGASTTKVARIVLTGFMGSGKTTVGRLLARRLQWDFADLDDRVVSGSGLSVPRIFAKYGESYFRQAEEAALRDLLREARIVIALGGGAVETSSLRGLLASTPDTAVIHLHARFEVLYERCVVQAQDDSATERPLARERGAAAERYTRRQALYAAVAHHTANAELTSPDAVVALILDALAAQLILR